MIIGEKIKARRKELGWSLAELGDRMGYNKSTVLRIERGEVDLPQSRIAQFAQVLDVKPSYLMGWDVEPEDAGTLAAKVLKDKDLFQLVSDYLGMEEKDRYALRLVASSIKVKKD